jgi:DNA-binding LacI/PurR family transcriptional regulator
MPPADVPADGTRDGAAGERLTIAAIARELNLSVATISKVLNGRPDVSRQTRSLVQDVLATRGYRRRSSPTAEAPPVIDVVFQEFESDWALELLRGAVSAAHAAELTVAVTSLDGNERPVWLDRIISRGTRGIVLVLSQLNDRQRGQLRTRRVPFVVIDPRGEPGPDVDSVGATNWSGGLTATRHLLELGHRRIGVITGPADMLCSRARLDGYRAALETAQNPVAPELVRVGDFHLEGGYQGGKELLSLPSPPTAIFAGSDLQALGVLRAARELNLRVPEDLSLVGFDDLPIGDWTTPRLTTVRQPLSEMAALAVRMVLQDSAARARGERRVELATHLVVRESSAAPIR